MRSSGGKDRGLAGGHDGAMHQRVVRTAVAAVAVALVLGVPLAITIRSAPLTPLTPLAQERGELGRAALAAASRAGPQLAVWQRVILPWLVMAALACSALLITILVARRRARPLSEPFEALSAVPHRAAKGDRSAGPELSAIRETRRAQNATVGWLGKAIEKCRDLSPNASRQQRTHRAWLPAQLSPDRVGAAHRIGAVTGKAEQRWHDKFDRDDRQLVVQLDPDATATEVPGALVTQVLDVLIDNALRHGRGDVTLTARQFGETLAVDVADQGSIAMESAAVFDRGTSGGDGRRTGLALARSRVETHGGRLVVGRRSPATFTLLLPGDVPDFMRPGWLAEQRTSPG
jgi:signal transduction histidine kinase